MKPTIKGALSIGVCFGIWQTAAIFCGNEAWAQNTYTYSTSSASTAWMNSANWTGGAANKFPGVDASASTTADGNAGDSAIFGSLTASGTLGINFNNTSANSGNGNNGNANGSLTLGSISVNNTLNKDITLGKSDSSAFAGVLTLGGATVNSVANVILRNSDDNNLTFAGFSGVSGSFPMSLALGNATDNKIYIDGTGGITISSIISGNKLSLAGSGSGVLTLSAAAANTYSGNTTISSGTLSIGNDTATLGDGTGTLVLAGGTFFRASQSTAQTFANPISVTADSFIAGNPASGSRTIPFSTSSFSGTAGTLGVTNTATSGSGLLQVRFSGAFTFSRPVTVGKVFSGSGIMLQFYNSVATGDQTWSGLITGNGILYKNVSSGAGGNVILSSGNSYTGGTEIRGGFFGLGADNALGFGNVTLGFDSNPLGLFASGAARSLTNDIVADVGIVNSTNLQIKGSQNFTHSGRIVITNFMQFIISNTALTTFSGIVTNIGASVGITKSGPGTLALSGTNTYSGSTLIAAGILFVNTPGGSGTSTGMVTVASGGTLGGSGLILGVVTNQFGGTLQPGFGGLDTSTLTISNSLGLAGNALFTLNRTNAQNAAKVSGLASVRYGGTLTLTNVATALQFGDTFTLFSSAAYSGGFTNLVLPALTGGLVWNTNNLSINGSVSVQKGATALALSSSSNPSGYLQSVTFTANVTPSAATGSVIFFAGATPFSTNSLTLGSATSGGISSLPRGTNLITAIYGGDTSYFPSTNSLNQVVTNHPPVAGSVSYTRLAGMATLHIAVSNLLGTVTDADSDTISFGGANTSTNNVMLISSPGYLHYYNTNNVDDRFTYTVTDGFGGTNSATVSITISTNSVFGQTSPSIDTTGGSATLTFAGIPGFSYSVLRSTNVLFTLFDTVLTTNAPAGGVFQWIDSTPPQPSAFYRLQYNP